MRLGHLEDYTAEELLELPYTDICTLRRGAFKRHVAQMRKDDEAAEGDGQRTTAFCELAHWADRMARRYGPTVKVHHNALPWLEALMVVRYGEDPMQWPPAFSDHDVARAKQWWRGKTPFNVQYLDEDGEAGLITLAPLTGGLWWLLGLLGLLPLMSALSDYLENEIIDWLFRGRTFTPPDPKYMALYTAAPGETGGGTEVSGGSYARVSIADGFANWLGTGGETTNVDSTGTGGQTENRNAITFPTPSANWGSVTHMALLDASSGGNFLLYGALTAAKTINNGDPAPEFQAGDFTVAFA